MSAMRDRAVVMMDSLGEQAPVMQVTAVSAAAQAFALIAIAEELEQLRSLITAVATGKPTLIKEQEPTP